MTGEEALLKSDSDSPSSSRKTSEGSGKLEKVKTYADACKSKSTVWVVQPRRSPRQVSEHSTDKEPAAFDSHFHQDCLGIRLGVNLFNIEELITKVTVVPPRNSVLLSGGVMIYCDPEHHGQVHLTADRTWQTHGK